MTDTLLARPGGGALAGGRPGPAVMPGGAPGRSARDSMRRRAALAAGTGRESTTRLTAAELRQREIDRARQRARDSVARAERQVQPDVRRDIGRYRTAIESRDLATLKAAWPRMSEGQEESWKEIFDVNESIDATVAYPRPAVITPGSIDAPFDVSLRYVNRVSKQVSTSRINLHAVFRKEGSGWVLTEIRPR